MAYSKVIIALMLAFSPDLLSHRHQEHLRQLLRRVLRHRWRLLLLRHQHHLSLPLQMLLLLHLLHRHLHQLHQLSRLRRRLLPVLLLLHPLLPLPEVLLTLLP
uniref:Putative ovule protein n=1 Tax=Solanum chacoense TaxID=4108 RepID=A0A0V0GQA6_SOLCH